MRGLLVFVMTMVLIGCGEDPNRGGTSDSKRESIAADPAESPGAGQSRVAEGASPTDAEFASRELRSSLPEGIQLPFPYHRLNDNTVEGGEGPQRRIYVEIRRVRPEQAEGLTVEALSANGFVVSSSEGRRGASETTLERDDGVRITIRVEHGGREFHAPDATGKLHLVWDPA